MESDIRFWLTLTVDAAACIAFFHVGFRLMCLSLLGVAAVFLVSTVLMVWAAHVGSAVLAGAG